MTADDFTPNTAENTEPACGTDVQTDLFSLPGGQAASAAENETAPGEAPETDPPPVRTDAADASAKKPLVFSEQEPRPYREGENMFSSPKKKHAVRPHRAPVHLDPKSFGADCTFGDLLKAAREKTGMSIEETASITKLRAYYLIAMENAELEKLPPPVYVNAYVRTLCSVYALDDESVAFVREKLCAIPAGKDVPLSLISELESNGQSNEAENRRIKRLILAGSAALVLFVLCIAGIIVGSVVSGSSAPDPAPSSEVLTAQTPTGGPEFTDEEFDRLTVPQQMPSSSLKMSRKPALNE